MLADEKSDTTFIISFLPEGSLQDLKTISEELLNKGGLVDFYEHLKQL